MFRWVIFVLSLCFVFSAYPVNANDDISRLIDPNTPATDVNDMLNKVNALRASKQLPPLTLNGALTGAAQEQADYISHTGNYAHVRNGSSPGSRALSAGYQTTEWCCSENTHRTQVGKSAWLFWNYSKPHYYNMINPKWTEIGVATSNVSVWTGWVLVFGSGIQETPAEVIPATPIPTPVAPTTTTVSSPAAAEGNYKVVFGDTLFKIAQRFGVSVTDLRTLNGISGNMIYAGQMLMIPNGQSAPSGGNIPISSTILYTNLITSPRPGQVMRKGFSITGTARFDAAQAVFYKVEISGGQFGDQWVTIGETHTANVMNGQLEYLNPVEPGSYSLRLVIVGMNGSPLGPSHTVSFAVQ